MSRSPRLVADKQGHPDRRSMALRCSLVKVGKLEGVVPLRQHDLLQNGLVRCPHPPEDSGILLFENPANLGDDVVHRVQRGAVLQ